MRVAGPYRRILAGFDGSPDAADAVRAAAALAARDGGHVVALSVLRRAQHPDGEVDRAESSGGGDGGGIRELAETLFRELRQEMPVTGTVRLTFHAVYTDLDSPAQVVTDYAAEHGFDVLVLGRHGNGRRRRTRLGQVAERAVQQCAVPVFLLSAQ
jgi:nucleotide-binding universal stress UspA family protein